MFMEDHTIAFEFGGNGKSRLIYTRLYECSLLFISVHIDMCLFSLHVLTLVFPLDVLDKAMCYLSDISLQILVPLFPHF